MNFFTMKSKRNELAIIVLLIGISMIISLFSAIGLEFYEVLYMRNHFDIQSFATAMATLFGVTGTVVTTISYGMGFIAKHTNASANASALDKNREDGTTFPS